MEFLLSLEVFATMTMLGAFALLIACAFGLGRSGDKLSGLLCIYRMRLWNCTDRGEPLPILLLCLQTPYYGALHAVGLLRISIELSDPYADQSARTNCRVQIDLAGFVSGWTVEAGAYIGLPLLLIVALYVHRHWAEPTGKLLTYCLAGAIVFSLGPILHIYLPGHPLRLVLPWWMMAKLPLLENAMPVRFSMYSFLVLAIICACYFARDVPTLVAKITLITAVTLFNLPNTSPAFLAQTGGHAGLLSRRRLSALLAREPNSLDSALWLYWQLHAVAVANANVLQNGGRHIALSRAVSFFAMADLSRVFTHSALSFLTRLTSLERFIAAHWETIVVLDNQLAV